MKIDIFEQIEKVFLLYRKVTMESQNDATNHYCNRIFHRVDACNMGHHGTNGQQKLIAIIDTATIQSMNEHKEKGPKTQCLY